MQSWFALITRYQNKKYKKKIKSFGIGLPEFFFLFQYTEVIYRSFESVYITSWYIVTCIYIHSITCHAN